jgi:hypothetical protein
VGRDVVDGQRLFPRARRDVSELGPDPGLHRGDVYVARRHHRHAVGPVPGAVERAQAIGGEPADDLGRADGEAVGIAGSVEEHGQLLPLDAPGCALPKPPLLEHDSALLLDLRVGQGRARGEIGQGEESLLHEAGLVGGDVQHVDGLIEGRVRVGIGAEAGTDGLQVRDQLPRLEVLAPVEVHVLEEVGQAALVVVLEDGSRLDRQAEGHALLGAAVLADVVGDPVGEPPDPDGGVDGEDLVESCGGGSRRRGRLWHGGGGRRQRGQQHRARDKDPAATLHPSSVRPTRLTRFISVPPRGRVKVCFPGGTS